MESGLNIKSTPGLLQVAVSHFAFRKDLLHWYLLS